MDTYESSQITYSTHNVNFPQSRFWELYDKYALCLESVLQQHILLHVKVTSKFKNKNLGNNRIDRS